MVKSGKNRSGKKKSDSPHAGNVVFEKASEREAKIQQEPTLKTVSYPRFEPILRSY